MQDVLHRRLTVNRIILILSCILSPIICKPQGVDNLWLLGYDTIFQQVTGKMTIDFSGGFPSITSTTRPMSMYASNASISNSNGNLLFYTNGVYIANANNDTMLNGDGLNPSAYTTQESDGLSIVQSDIVIPFPGDSMKYYLFHETIDTLGFIPLYLYYSIIDMTLDNGLGGVVSKNNILFSRTLGNGALTACKHGNGRDWWLVVREYAYDYDNNTYLKYLITHQGIQGPFFQSIGKLRIQGLGQVVFSPDGVWYANYDTEGDLDLMNFDRCSGTFSNLIHVPIDDSAYVGGAAFSSDSKKLYISSEKYVYQFDLNSSNIPSTQTTVAVWDSFYSPVYPFATTFFLSQLAADGRIYINCGPSTKDIHVINYPDSLGLACNVCQHCIHLPTYNAFTIPNYPNYFLGAYSGSVCDTLTAINNIKSAVDQELIVFPNPVSKVLYATIHKEKRIKTAKIFNALGQEIPVYYTFIKNGEYLEMNVSGLSQGVYFLELLSDKEKVVKRFIKN